MSVDLAQLGLEVRSDGVVVASDRLDKFSRSSKKAETAAERLGKEVEAVGKRMQRLGRSMSMYVTAPLLAIGGASAKLTTEFDSTLTKMNTLVGVSRKEIAGFRKEILAISPSVGRGPAELADALFAITSAGQRGTQALDTLKKAAMASAIGLGDTRTIALAATAAVQAYGSANMDSTKSLEILIGTIEQGNLAAEELAPVLGRVIGISAELGVAFEDVGAFIATFTRLGVNADEAATALRATLGTIQKPAKEAIDAFEQMGTSVEEVRRKIKEDGFIVAFQDLVNRSREFNVDLINIVPNIRALSGVLGVFGGEGKVAEEVLEGVSAAVGTMQERFEAVQELDPAFAFQQMKAEMQALAIEISRDLLPALLEIAGEVRNLAKWFRSLNPETQTAIVRFTAIAAAAGPLLLVVGSLVRTIGMLIPLIAKLSAVLATRLATSLLTIFGPTGLVIAGVTALGFLGAAMLNTKRKATELDREIETIIESMRNMEKTSAQIAIENVNLAIEENDALITRLHDNMQTLIDLQSMPMGAEASDRTARQIANLAVEIQAAEAEGEHLRNQLERLAKAQEDMAYKTALAAGELDEIAVSAERIDEAGGNMLEWTKKEADALTKLVDELDPAGAEMRELAKQQKLLEKAFKVGAKNGGITEKQYVRMVRALHKLTSAYKDAVDAAMQLDEIDFAVASDLDANFEYIDSLVAMREEVEALEESFDPMLAQTRALADAYKSVSDAFEAGAIDEETFFRVSEAIDRAADSMTGLSAVFDDIAQNWIPALRDAAGMFDQDSQAAKDLHRVITALNIVMGIHAVIKQLAEGDVYSAIPRALAVAGLVASMGLATGASGGAANQSLAERRQDAQGAGSVLGDAQEKTESIVRATEITATATSELVGINRGMLHALQALQAGISGATGAVARGTGGMNSSVNTDIPFAAGALATGGAIGGYLLGQGMGWWLGILGGPLGLILGGVLGSVLGKLLGGSSKVIDEGVAIMAGDLQAAMNGELIKAFQTVKYKKWRWGSSKKKDFFGDLPDEASRQISLIFQAIGDTVREGAIALGMDIEEIEKALATFQIAEQKISFEGLNAEEQQKELEAVFGQIFDDLARHVIPWLDEFQQVGEGLGETLVRVATSVQVFQEAVTALGFAADKADPHAFAQMAVGLVEMVGGVEEFIAQFSTFFDKFASDEQKLEFVTSQLSRAFESVGLVIPDTRDGMIDLMRSLDASTESGQRQIAMLLEVAGVADEYYSLVERAEDERLKQAREFAAAMQAYKNALSSFLGTGAYGPLQDLRDAFNEAMRAADALNASQREYAMITRKFNADLKRMSAELTLSLMSTIDQLFGTGDDGINSTVTEGFEETREVVNSVFEEWQQALESIKAYTESLLLDEQLTTLTPAEQLREAQSQFDDVLRKALSGDVDAARDLPGAAQALLEEARFMYASGNQYTKIFEDVMRDLNRVKTPGGVKPTIIERVDIDYDRQADLIGDSVASSLERYLLALDIAEGLRHLSDVTGKSVIDLADELGVPLRELVELLGVSLSDFSDTTAYELAGIAEMLGTEFTDLVTALNLNLGDLASAMGMNLDAFGVGLIKQAIAFADAVGISLVSVLEALGLEVSIQMKKLLSKLGDDIPPSIVKIITSPDPDPVIVKKIYDKYGYKKGFATGGYVGQTGLHQLHAGEFVINRAANNVSPAPDNSLTQEELKEIRAVLTEIREDSKRYHEQDLASSREMESSMKDQAEQTRRLANSG